MKKSLCLLLVMFVLLPMLAGCGKEEKKSVSVTNNIERYFLYVENDELNLLDSKNESTKNIALDFSVESVSNALVCDDSAVMVASVSKKTGGTGLIYWDGKSEKAEYLGDDTELVRVAEDGKTVVYTKAEELYRYNAKENESKWLLDSVNSVSVSQDGKHLFATTRDYSSYKLHYSKKGGEWQEIANTYTRPNVSVDGTAVAYTKMEEQLEGLAYQAYLWTAGKGEEKLPFGASEITVFSADDIYYMVYNSDLSAAKHYYYDGKESYLLTENGKTHGHKAGRYMYYYREETYDRTCFRLAYKGKILETDINYCHIMGYYGLLSADDKSFYGWGYYDEAYGVLFRVDLTAGGELKETKLMYTDGYSPRKMDVAGDSVLYQMKDGLYFNEEKLTDTWDSREISIEGDAALYTQDAQLFVYQNGITTTYDVKEAPDVICSAWKEKAVSWANGEPVQLCTGEKIVAFGTEVTDLVPVYTWSLQPLTNILVGAERTGVWFQGKVGSLIWKY